MQCHSARNQRSKNKNKTQQEPRGRNEKRKDDQVNTRETRAQRSKRQKEAKRAAEAKHNEEFTRMCMRQQLNSGYQQDIWIQGGAEQFCIGDANDQHGTGESNTGILERLHRLEQAAAAPWLSLPAILPGAQPHSHPANSNEMYLQNSNASTTEHIVNDSNMYFGQQNQ